MALENTQGNYLKIQEIKLDQKIAVCHKWKDITTRQAPTEFDAFVEESHYINKFDEMGENFTSTGNINQDILTVAYLALKNEPPFTGASGETWTDT